MEFDQRESGLPLIGELPWGSNVCQFYQTAPELLDILVPFFQAGLERNELCVWVTPEISGDEDTRQALEAAAPHFAQYDEHGQLAIISADRWTAMEGTWDRSLISMLDRAVAGGYDGLRLVCQVLTEAQREQVLASSGFETIARFNILALFAYPRSQFDAAGLIAVTKEHRFALLRNGNRWEVIESSEARVMRDALKRSEEKLKSLFNNMSEGFAYHRIVLDDRGRPCDYVFLEVNEAFERLTGLSAKKIIGRKVTAAMPGIEQDPTDWIGRYGEVALTGRPMQFESYSQSLKRWYAVSAFSPQKGHFAVTFSDITERKQAEEQIARLNEELQKKVTELSAANASLRDSRRAALNLMEDAVAAQKRYEEANDKLRATIEELTRFNRSAVGRELRMIELKKEINELRRQAGEPERFPLEFLQENNRDGDRSDPAGTEEGPGGT